MCQYSSIDGLATDWHFVHLGSRAVGGAALVFVEATAVEARGRISPDDMGIWSDPHIEPFSKITAFISSEGALPGIQLAHAGRKASTSAPWKGRKVLDSSNGGWEVVAPSPIPFSKGYSVPHELTEAEIEDVISQFQAAAERSVKAGFRVIEIHSAHGYLLNSFLSPLSNKRQDKYGGSLENRMRLAIAVSKAVRDVIPDTMPLFVRISATDWVEGGWDVAQSVVLAKALKEIGVDVIDCSSGFVVPDAKAAETPGFQVPLSARIKTEAGILTSAVGMITEPEQAEEILEKDEADIISLARELLRDPYWPHHAAKKLGAEGHWPKQYLRAVEQK
jgi:NADH:flavin oxidoreductases, Old Yellow Enzyme family